MPYNQHFNSDIAAYCRYINLLMLQRIQLFFKLLSGTPKGETAYTTVDLVPREHAWISELDYCGIKLMRFSVNKYLF